MAKLYWRVKKNGKWTWRSVKGSLRGEDLIRIAKEAEQEANSWADLECFDTGCKCEACLELQHLEEEE